MKTVKDVFQSTVRLIRSYSPVPAVKSLLLSLGMVTLLLSCNMNSNPEEVQPRSSVANKESVVGGPIFSLPVAFHRVDIITSSSSTISGTVTMQIRNADGTVVVGSSTVSGNSLLRGHMLRNTFLFSPALTLNSGQKYRIYLTRSNPHNYINDHIAWRCSSGGTNPYTSGVPSVYPGWQLDFTFVTYSGGYVDQQQLQPNYGFSIGNNGYYWQEFVPQYIWIVQP